MPSGRRLNRCPPGPAGPVRPNSGLGAPQAGRSGPSGPRAAPGPTDQLASRGRPHERPNGLRSGRSASVEADQARLALGQCGLVALTRPAAVPAGARSRQNRAAEPFQVSKPVLGCIQARFRAPNATKYIACTQIATHSWMIAHEIYRNTIYQSSRQAGALGSGALQAATRTPPSQKSGT